MGGVTTYYNKYVNEMKEKQKKRLAPLQLVSKIEEFLVKEFANFVISESSGKDFVLTNYGCKGEPRIDMCFITGEHKKPYIYGMLEAKYFRNIHRITEVSKARDELSGGLNSLHKQIGNYSKDKHCDLEVRLNSKENRIYGMVFAYHVTYKEKKDSDCNEFFDIICNKAKSKFVFYDLKDQNPRLDTVYEREEVQVLGKTAYATLKVGLWVKKQE